MAAATGGRRGFAGDGSGPAALVPVFPVIGTALCLYLMSKLPGDTWLRFGIWLVVGLVIYSAYGRRHSRMQRGETERPIAEQAT